MAEPKKITFTLDDLDRPEVGWVLDLMVFQTGPAAHLFRATGEEIPPKVELEQRFILRWLLKLALEHGEAWPKFADEETQRRRALLLEKARG